MASPSKDPSKEKMKIWKKRKNFGRLNRLIQIIQMNMRRMKKVILLVSFGMLCGLFGIALHIGFPGFLKRIIEEKLALSPDSEVYSLWKDVPVPIYLSVYLFNLTNPMAVYQQTSDPIFEELGPYTYREYRKKINIVWNDNGTVSYRQKKWFVFQPHLTNGSLDDKVTQINALMMSAAARAKRQNSYLVYFAISETLDSSNSSWFIQRPVRELLFEGYTDHFFNLSKKLATLPFDKFGWFYGANDTDKGLFNVFTGSTDMRKYDEMDNYNGSPNISAFDPPCNAVSGSAGDMFPPILKKEDNLSFFATEICRPLRFSYLEDQIYDGIDVFKYRADNSSFDNGEINSTNRCFCKGTCMPTGAVDISPCQHGAPIVVSFPHFLFADSSYTQGLIGLKPDIEKHESFVEVQPDFGIVMKAAAKLQFNVIFEKDEYLPQFQNLSGRIYFPVFWVSETAALDETMTYRIRLAINIVPTAAKVISYITISIGILLFIIAFIYSTLNTSPKVVIIYHPVNMDSEFS